MHYYFCTKEFVAGVKIDNYILERREIKSSIWISQLVYDTTTLVPTFPKHEFRVYAINALGQSEPLVTDSTTVIKNPVNTFVYDQNVVVQHPPSESCELGTCEQYVELPGTSNQPRIDTVEKPMIVGKPMRVRRFENEQILEYTYF